MNDGRTHQERLADALAQDARVQLETRMLPDGRLSAEQLDAIRAEVNDYLSAKGLSLALVSKSTNYSRSTLSEVLKGTYKGAFEKCLRELHTFIEQHRAGLEAGMPKGFISTRIAERILGVMRHAQETRTLALIYGPAGVSKSMCARAAERELIVGSVHIECLQTTRSPSAFLSLLARRLGAPSTRRAFETQFDIIERLRGSSRLLIIDEAHYLNIDALNVVRDIMKQANVGCVLMGTRPKIEERVHDFHEFYGQMTRLISATYDIVEDSGNSGSPMFSVDEIITLAKSAQLRLTPDGASWLQMRANIPGWGGLGAASTVMATAAKVAGRGAAIDVKHLRVAERAQRGAASYEIAEIKASASERKAAIA